MDGGLPGLDDAQKQVFACLSAWRGDIENAERTFRVSSVGNSRRHRMGNAGKRPNLEVRVQLGSEKFTFITIICVALLLTSRE